MRPDVERFILVLQYADRFVQTRIADGRDVGEFMEAQVVSLLSQMAVLNIDMVAASEVADAIEKGKWPEAHRHRLTDAAVAFAMKAPPVGLKGLRRDTQKCYWFERYLCDEDWEVLKSEKPLSVLVVRWVQHRQISNLSLAIYVFLLAVLVSSPVCPRTPFLSTLRCNAVYFMHVNSNDKHCA